MRSNVENIDGTGLRQLTPYGYVAPRLLRPSGPRMGRKSSPRLQPAACSHGVPLWDRSAPDQSAGRNWEQLRFLAPLVAGRDQDRLLGSYGVPFASARRNRQGSVESGGLHILPNRSPVLKTRQVKRRRALRRPMRRLTIRRWIGHRPRMRGTTAPPSPTRSSEPPARIYCSCRAPCRTSKSCGTSRGCTASSPD